jgi:hypothetical protein
MPHFSDRSYPRSQRQEEGKRGKEEEEEERRKIHMFIHICIIGGYHD